MYHKNSDNLLTCISDIYQTIEDSSHWQTVLQRLSEYVTNGKGSVTARNNDSGFVDVLDLFNTKTFKISDKYIESYLQKIYLIDEWIGIEEKRSLGDICVFHEHLPISNLKKTDFYKLWLEPQGISDGIAMQLYKNENIRIVLNIFHNDGSSKLDKLVYDLELLKPHLCRSASLKMDGDGANRLSLSISRTRYLIASHGLTERQLEAATAFIRLGSRKKAAIALNVAESTIKSHVDTVKDRMGNLTTHQLMLKLFSFSDKN